MKHLILIATLSFMTMSLSAYAGEPALDVDHDQLKENMSKLDSQIKELNTTLEDGREKMRKEQLERTLQHNQRNMEHFMAQQKEQKKKRDRWNIFRAILLVVTIVAAIVGRTNRKKAQKAQAELDSSEANNQSE